MKKKKIIIAIILIVIAIGLFIVSLFVDNDKDKENKKNAVENNMYRVSGASLASEREYKGLSISGAYISRIDEIYIFNANVINKSAFTIDELQFTIVLFDENKNEIARIPGTINAVNPSDTTRIVSQTLTDITKAFDYQIIDK